MKSLILFVLGLLVGAALVWLNVPADPARPSNRQKLVDKATEKASEVGSTTEELAWEEFSEGYFESCRKRYLAKTGCFQKYPAVECVKRVERKCGTP